MADYDPYEDDIDPVYIEGEKNLVEETLDSYHQIHDVADWQLVVTIDAGGGYSWNRFHAFYDPASRRYFWIGGSGCSCDAIANMVYSPAQFQNGDRAALLRAVEAHLDDDNYPSIPTGDAFRAVGTIQHFVPKETP